MMVVFGVAYFLEILILYKKIRITFFTLYLICFTTTVHFT